MSDLDNVSVENESLSATVTTFEEDSLQSSLSRESIFPPDFINEVNLLLSKFKKFDDGIPEGGIHISHVELILRALELDPSPLDLQELAEYSGSECEDYVKCSIFECIDYFMKRKSNSIELIRAYQKFDTEEKGFISLSDLNKAAKAAGENMTDIELKELIYAAEENNNGFVSKDEFFKFMKEVHLSLKEL